MKRTAHLIELNSGPACFENVHNCGPKILQLMDKKVLSNFYLVLSLFREDGLLFSIISINQHCEISAKCTRMQKDKKEKAVRKPLKKKKKAINQIRSNQPTVLTFSDDFSDTFIFIDLSACRITGSNGVH